MPTESKRFTRRDFLNLGKLTSIPVVLRLLFPVSLLTLQTACSPETERPLILKSPYIVGVGDQQFNFEQLDPAAKDYLARMLKEIPEIISSKQPNWIDPSTEPYNWPADAIKKPQGELMTQVTIYQGGSVQVSFASFERGQAHVLFPRGGEPLYIPADSAVYSNGFNNVTARISPIQEQVFGALTRGLDSLNAPNSYSNFIAAETVFYSLDKNGQRRPILVPGGAKFLADWDTNPEALNLGEYSASPLHDPEVATQVLENLLILSERGQLMVDTVFPQPHRLYAQEQPANTLGRIRPDHLSNTHLDVQDRLGDYLDEAKRTFKATLHEIPTELPVAYKITEQRYKDNGELEQRTRLLFLYSNGEVTENWHKSSQLKSLTGGTRVTEGGLSMNLQAALKLGIDGFTTVEVEEVSTHFYWDGEIYRPGTAYLDGDEKKIVLEMNPPMLFKDVYQKIKGADQRNQEEEGADIVNQVSDLTEMFYRLKDYGITHLGPAGLTIPEWMAKMLWGMEPQSPDLVQLFNQRDYDFPIFRGTSGSELDGSTPLAVYRGQSPSMLTGLGTEIFGTDYIQDFRGLLAHADMVPIWKTGVWDLPGLDKTTWLEIGGYLFSADGLPYSDGSFAMIKKDMLKRLKAFRKALDNLYNSTPQRLNQYSNEYVLPFEERRKRRKLLAQQLMQMAQV